MTLRTQVVRILTIVATLLLYGTSHLHAQGASSAITGKVTDQNGNAIPGAAVTVIDEATNAKTELQTNNDGIYSAESLSVSLFTVTISKAGFATSTTQHVHLDPGERRTNNISLGIGSQSSTVVVDADIAQVNTASSESGGTIDEKQVNNLMLNGRDFLTLAIAIPGVSSVVGTDQQTITTGNYLSVNGAAAETSVQTVDGIFNENTGNMFGIAVKPIVDGISEFSIMKDNYSAKYGFVGSAQILVVTKSGTSHLHGSAWEYIRNNAFDAKNYFSTITPPLHQNIFGYTLGGPVVIPHVYNGGNSGKTFFFASNQWYRVNIGTTQIGATIPQALRDGNFTNSLSRTGSLLLDAHSTALLASEGKTNCVPSTNMLNPACFDPVAVALVNAYYPLPNYSQNGFDNYINQDSSPSYEYDYQYRIDHHITNGELLTGRVIYMSQPTYSPFGGGGVFNTYTTDSTWRAFNGLFRLQSTITPNLVNNFSAGESEFHLVEAMNKGGFLPDGAHIEQAFPNAPYQDHIPVINIGGGYTGLSVDALPFYASDGEGMLIDDVSWVHGRHVFSTGALYMFGIKSQNVFTSPEGVFLFTGTHTGDPAADFLLGLDTTYSQTSTRRNGYFHYRQGEAYLQDDWRATNRLTLNMGVRWQYFSSDTVSGDAVTSFNAKYFNPANAPIVNIDGSLTVDSANNPLTPSGTVADPLNGMVFAGKNGVPDGFFIPKKDNFAPRVGFAYDIFGDGKSSVRGGYGIGYSRIPLEEIYDDFGQNPPYNQTANILNSLLSNGTAGGTVAAPTTQTLQDVPFSFTPTQTQTYSLTVEHQIISNMIASVAYVGSQTRHLMTYQGGYDANYPLPVNTPSTSDCLAPGQTPTASYDFDPCINTGKASPDYTRPYKGYSYMYDQYQDGSGNYNSLQSGLTYRGNPLQFTLAYTYGKSLTTVGSRSAQFNTAQIAQPQNPRNFHAEYGPPSYDFTHNISATWVYNLPKFSNAARPVRAAIADWGFAGNFLHQSGPALTPGIAGQPGSLTALRPNQVKPYKKVGERTEWFDTSIFDAPDYGHFGSASNGVIRAPGYTTVNMSLKKAFAITHEVQFQLSAEVFNVFNHPNFENLDGNLGSGTFGQLNVAGDPRIMEFSGKIVF